MTTELQRQFAEHYSQTYPKVFRVAVGFLGDPDRAEEVVHDAYLKAFQKYEEFRFESTFLTWIYRIVINACRDAWAERKKLPVEVFTQDMGYRLEDIADPDRENNPETVLLSREAQFKCLHCLTECLPPAQRKAFCLTVTLDLSHKLAAEILGTTEGAVKASLHRAMKRWRGYMENRCEFIRPGNPCRCHQWIRFGQERGWLKAPPSGPPQNEVNMVFRDEIVRLRDLRSVYQQRYLDKSDGFLAQRIAQGVTRGDWAIFSG